MSDSSGPWREIPEQKFVRQQEKHCSALFRQKDATAMTSKAGFLNEPCVFSTAGKKKLYYLS